MDLKGLVNATSTWNWHPPVAVVSQQSWMPAVSSVSARKQLFQQEVMGALSKMLAEVREEISSRKRSEELTEQQVADLLYQSFIAGIEWAMDNIPKLKDDYDAQAYSQGIQVTYTGSTISSSAPVGYTTWTIASDTTSGL